MNYSINFKIINERHCFALKVFWFAKKFSSRKVSVDGVFWTYAHPTYKHVVLTAVVVSMHSRSDGHVKNSILVHPTYFKLSLGHDSIGLMGRCFISQMGIFRRSDGHFS